MLWTIVSRRSSRGRARRLRHRPAAPGTGPAAGLTPCAGPTPPCRRAGPASHRHLVMIIRHGEKPDDDSTPGVDANGQRGRELADRGRLGAGAPPGRPVRPGAGRAAGRAGPPDDDLRRRRERRRRGPTDPRDRRPARRPARHPGRTPATARATRRSSSSTSLTQPGPTLISWQHSEIPAIAEAFGSVHADPAHRVARRPVRRGLDLHQDRRRLALRPASRARAAAGPGHGHRGHRGRRGLIAGSSRSDTSVRAIRGRGGSGRPGRRGYGPGRTPRPGPGPRRCRTPPPPRRPPGRRPDRPPDPARAAAAAR